MLHPLHRVLLSMSFQTYNLRGDRNLQNAVFGPNQSERQFSSTTVESNLPPRVSNVGTPLAPDSPIRENGGQNGRDSQPRAARDQLVINKGEIRAYAGEQ